MACNAYFSEVGVSCVVEELHGELVATQKDRVGVMLFCLEARAEVVQSRLRDYSRISYIEKKNVIRKMGYTPEVVIFPKRTDRQHNSKK